MVIRNRTDFQVGVPTQLAVQNQARLCITREMDGRGLVGSDSQGFSFSANAASDAQLVCSGRGAGQQNHPVRNSSLTLATDPRQGASPSGSWSRWWHPRQEADRQKS